jgi:hypothetical protein
MTTQEAPPLMDFMRPLDSNGALHSALLSTYGLSLSDPPFFDQDFLPTLLGLGGVRDRGYSSPANVERRLGQIYCGILCDARALAQGGRPSLRVDVMPVAYQLHHAKVVLIHCERVVRLVISSANLTHDGFRRNRETAVVLDFREGSHLAPSILADFAAEWLARVGSLATEDFRRALGEAADAAQRWKPLRTSEPTVRILWGGGQIPLWQRFLDVWPQGEPIREWQISSPFWPSPGETQTPFDVFSRVLNERGANVGDAKLTLFALADAPGPGGRPYFPYALVDQLAKRGFEPADATICPVRLDAFETGLPDGKAEDLRPLHAKWILLRGEYTSLLLIGSANFTRRGLGVVNNPVHANIEVCVMLSGTNKVLPTEGIVPPVATDGIVKWCDCRSQDLAIPQLEIELEPWPTFISGIELEVRWEMEPISGVLRITCPIVADFSLAWEKDDELLPLTFGPRSSDGVHACPLDETQIASVLLRRRIVVRWDEPLRKSYFPINIASDSKQGLPAVLGQDPTEQDLIDYFHGRIDEGDLTGTLEGRTRLDGDSESSSQIQQPPGRELQNYVMREFLEGLYGMENILRDSTYSPRAFEQALLGEFSPVRLAHETQRAFASGRRTATAAAFQLLELLRIIENLSPRVGEECDPTLFGKTRDRAMEQLLVVVHVASIRAGFCESCNAMPFQELLAAALKSTTTARWREAIERV